MKHLILLVALFASTTLYGQIVGDVSVTRKELKKSGNTLYLELEIGVSRSAVSDKESIAIIPEISTPDRKSVTIFPHIMIMSEYQRRVEERQERMAGDSWQKREPYIYIVPSKDTEFSDVYKMELPYKSWMDNASLVIRQIYTGPGGVRRIFTVDVNGAVDR